MKRQIIDDRACCVVYYNINRCKSVEREMCSGTYVQQDWWMYYIHSIQQNYYTQNIADGKDDFGPILSQH